MNQPIPSSLSFNKSLVFTAMFNRNTFKGLIYLCNKDAKKLKNLIKYILQKIFGLNTYLYLFARFMIVKLPFDRKESDFIRFLKLIKNQNHVLDVGANIGVMTYHFSKKLNNATVHSFEPVEINFNILKKIVRKKKLNNVNTLKMALGDKNQQVQMIMPHEQNVYLHGLSHVKNDTEKLQGRVFNVEMRKLDDINELKDKQVEAIKLDVENYEYSVLIGGAELIKTNRPLIYIELWEGNNKTQCFNFLSGLNYRAFVNFKGQLLSYDKQKNIQNFFFIPAEHCDELKL